MESQIKHLYRSENDKIIAGVAGGLGEYFEVDPTLVRIVFVLLTLISGGLGILFYIILAIILPCCPENETPRKEEPKKPADEIKQNVQSLASELKNRRNIFEEKKNFIGILLILLGMFILLEELLPEWVNMNLLWPVIIILIGLYVLSKSGPRKQKNEGK
ncbi:MAG: PspC domain-containing protein [Patescibacteria group bacterium]|nr:PspC domain-containing protein [Patescibacteria group bacterium]